MLLSLLKIIAFVAAVAALAIGADYLLDSEGGLRIVLPGDEFTLGPLQSVIALIVLAIVVWLLIKLAGLLIATLHFINGDETALSRYFARNREAKGYTALSQSMLALASGEGRVAVAKAERAERYLKKPELTNLVTAQAAEMAGDRKKAEETYKKLLADDSTRFVGVRGILKQRLADGDKDTAMELAKKAFALKPKHEETQDILLQLQAEHEDWVGARQTLSAKLKNGNLPRDVYKRRDAVLALSEARKVFDEDLSIEAREAAIEANKLSPDLIPAAVMAADSYVQKNQPKYATRVIKKTWAVLPHPDLAAAFARIVPDEPAEARLKRFNVLTRQQPDHPETKMLLAELLIAAEDFPAARRALGDLIETDLTSRSATLMAAIERGEGASDAVVQGWMARALTAPRGPQWVCDKCQHIHADWRPFCENCHAFDTLTWKRPPETQMPLPGGAEMLPLIVGSTAAKQGTDLVDGSSAADRGDNGMDDGTIEDAELLPEEPSEGDEKPPAQKT